MYGVELYAAVRLAVVAEGLSHHEARRRFGIDRRTVKKMLDAQLCCARQPDPPGGTAQRLGRTVTKIVSNRSVSPWHRPTDPRVRCAQMTALGALRPFITSARP